MNDGRRAEGERERDFTVMTLNVQWLIISTTVHKHEWENAFFLNYESKFQFFGENMFYLLTHIC